MGQECSGNLGGREPAGRIASAFDLDRAVRDVELALQPLRDLVQEGVAGRYFAHGVTREPIVRQAGRPSGTAEGGAP